MTIRLLVAVLFAVSMAHAGEISLAFQERLESCRQILNDADPQFARDSIEQIEESESSLSEARLLILEALSAAYSEIVKEYDVKDQKKKEWLLSMIQLNMAYLQLGGLHQAQDESHLNRLIVRKLKAHLPKELLDDSSVFYSLN